MSRQEISPFDIEEIQEAARRLRVRLHELENFGGEDLEDWVSLIDSVFSNFYVTLYKIVMAPDRHRPLAVVPPLDSRSHADYAIDIIDLQTASIQIYDILSNNVKLSREREIFPEGEMGDVCFKLAHVLLHLADFQFPTRGRLSTKGENLLISIDDEYIQIRRTK